MTQEDKITKVMKALGLNRTDAIEQVHFLDWMTAEDEFLHEIYPQYKIDFDPTASFVQMCYTIWTDKSTGERDAWMRDNVTSPENKSK